MHSVIPVCHAVVLGWLNFWVFLPSTSQGKPNMNHALLQAEFHSPTPPLPSDSLMLPELPEREPIRHLLIGSPAAVQLTIHRLHTLHYVDAGLWSPAIALPPEQLILTLHPGEVMRVLVRYLQVQR
jgi:hypothetical protein